METINWSLIIAFASFVFAWIVSPMVKQAGVNTRVDELCKIVKGQEQAIKAIEAKQAWQEKAEYVLENLTKSNDKLSDLVAGLDGKFNAVLVQVTQISGETKSAQEKIERVDDRVSILEGDARERDKPITSRGR